MSDPTPKKKGLWQLLNTPVQDLLKKEDETLAVAPAAPPASAASQAEMQPAAAPAAAPTPKSGSAATAVAAPEPAAAPERAAKPAPEEAPLAPVSEPVSEPVLPTPPEPDVLPAQAQIEAVAEQAPEALNALAPVAPIAPIEPPVETAVETPESAAEAQAKAAKAKRSLWELLNTPVQDLFKDGEVTVEGETVAADGSSELDFLGLGRDKPQLEGKEKQSWLAHFRSRLSRTRSQFAESITRLAKGRTKVDEDMLEELEEILLQSDVGVATTDDILEHLRNEAKQRRFLPEEVLPALSTYLEKQLESEPFRIEEGRLNIFLVVGVNGTGKTTTVGKIGAKLKLAGYRVMLAAGDTFRAAAIDQLAVWGKRVGCPVVQHHEGADAAAVVFDAIRSARAKKVDALLIDTAGRLHNKEHLMEELKKVYRIVEREKEDARVECVLVLDATTGQNGLRQAEVFAKAVPLSSLILTKLDGTAKGGVIFGIKRELGIPIKLLGVGEHLGDLQEFDPKSFVQALFSEEEVAETLGI